MTFVTDLQKECHDMLQVEGKDKIRFSISAMWALSQLGTHECVETSWGMYTCIAFLLKEVKKCETVCEKMIEVGTQRHLLACLRVITKYQTGVETTERMMCMEIGINLLHLLVKWRSSKMVQQRDERKNGIKNDLPWSCDVLSGMEGAVRVVWDALGEYRNMQSPHIATGYRTFYDTLQVLVMLQGSTEDTYAEILRDTIRCPQIIIEEGVCVQDGRKLLDRMVRLLYEVQAAMKTSIRVDETGPASEFLMETLGIVVSAESDADEEERAGVVFTVFSWCIYIHRVGSGRLRVLEKGRFLELIIDAMARYAMFMDIEEVGAQLLLFIAEGCFAGLSLTNNRCVGVLNLLVSSKKSEVMRFLLRFLQLCCQDDNNLKEFDSVSGWHYINIVLQDNNAEDVLMQALELIRLHLPGDKHVLPTQREQVRQQLFTMVDASGISKQVMNSASEIRTAVTSSTLAMSLLARRKHASRGARGAPRALSAQEVHAKEIIAEKARRELLEEESKSSVSGEQKGEPKRRKNKKKHVMAEMGMPVPPCVVEAEQAMCEAPNALPPGAPRGDAGLAGLAGLGGVQLAPGAPRGDAGLAGLAGLGTMQLAPGAPRGDAGLAGLAGLGTMQLAVHEAECKARNAGENARMLAEKLQAAEERATANETRMRALLLQVEAKDTELEDMRNDQAVQKTALSGLATAVSDMKALWETGCKMEQLRAAHVELEKMRLQHESDVAELSEMTMLSTHLTVSTCALQSKIDEALGLAARHGADASVLQDLKQRPLVQTGVDVHAAAATATALAAAAAKVAAVAAQDAAVAAPPANAAS